MEILSLIGMLTICSVEDIKSRKVNAMLICSFGIIGVTLHLYSGRISLLSMLGGMGIGLILLAVSYFTEEEIGKGDGLIFLASGVYLGFADTVALLFISALICGITGLMLVLLKKKGWEYELPFAPFILVAYLIILSMSWINR